MAERVVLRESEAADSVIDIPVRKEWVGTFSKREKFLTAIAKTQKEWKKIWDEIGAPEPFVMPAGYTAVAVFLGSRPTGGHHVFIDHMRVSTDKMQVVWRETKPDSDQLVTQVITSPYAIKLIPNSSKEITFIKNQ